MNDLQVHPVRAFQDNYVWTLTHGGNAAVVDPGEAGPVLAFLRGAPAQRHAGERWRCAQCGESLEGQFTECWNCGASRPVTA